jgi:hypothetical protein
MRLYWCEPDGITFRDCGMIHRQCVPDATGLAYTCGGCYTCDGECADVMTSLAHCGGCGRTCAPPDAVGICEAGDCRIARCKKGWADENGDLRDGCEVELPDEGCAGTGEARPLVALAALLLLVRRRR